MGIVLFGLNSNECQYDAKQKEFLQMYWDRYAKAHGISKNYAIMPSELLILIPNNARKLHGFPMMKISGSNKRMKKARAIEEILSLCTGSHVSKWWLRTPNACSLDHTVMNIIPTPAFGFCI